MTQTQRALNQLASDVHEARQDIKNGFLESADMILGNLERQIGQIKREQLPLDIEEAKAEVREAYQGACEQSYRQGYEQKAGKAIEDIDNAMSEARTSIGTFFEDLRAIYEPKEGNMRP